VARHHDHHRPCDCVFLESHAAGAGACRGLHRIGAHPRQRVLPAEAGVDAVRDLPRDHLRDRKYRHRDRLPFGHYHFEVDAGLPHIGLIPIIVGPLWFGAGYFSWVLATILLDGADRALGRRFNFMALPIVAAFVMTQWDFVMDAPNSTIAKVWIWHDGGGVFGVPLSNYLGWFLTSWLFFTGFALYLRRQSEMRALGTTPSFKLRAIAILFYVSAGLTHVIPWVLGSSGEVVDGAGHAWRIADIREGTVAIMLFTMLFTAVLAALRLLDAADEHSTRA
jgi:uncharacterized membrane protein